MADYRRRGIPGRDYRRTGRPLGTGAGAVIPLVASLVIAAVNPTVVASSTVQITPQVAVVEIEGVNPTVIASSTAVFTPLAGTVEIQGVNPNVDLGSGISEFDYATSRYWRL